MKRGIDPRNRVSQLMTGYIGLTEIRFLSLHKNLYRPGNRIRCIDGQKVAAIFNVDQPGISNRLVHPLHLIVGDVGVVPSLDEEGRGSDGLDDLGVIAEDVERPSPTQIPQQGCPAFSVGKWTGKGAEQVGCKILFVDQPLFDADVEE